MSNERRANRREWLFRWHDSGVERLCPDNPMKFRMMAKAVREGQATVQEVTVPKADDVPFDPGDGKARVRVGRSVMTPEARKAEIEAKADVEATRLAEKRQADVARIDAVLAQVASGKVPRMEGI